MIIHDTPEVKDRGGICFNCIKDNPRFYRGDQKAYSEGRSRQGKSSLLE